MLAIRRLAAHRLWWPTAAEMLVRASHSPSFTKYESGSPPPQPVRIKVKSMTPTQIKEVLVLSTRNPFVFLFIADPR
jgi:hypothetical protein